MSDYKALLVFIDGSNSGQENPPAAQYRWPWVYAHGEFQDDYDFDIVLFNQDEPTVENYYIATAQNNKTVIINLVADEYGRMKGRCCYVDDEEALRHIKSPQDWG